MTPILADLLHFCRDDHAQYSLLRFAGLFRFNFEMLTGQLQPLEISPLAPHVNQDHESAELEPSGMTLPSLSQLSDPLISFI